MDYYSNQTKMLAWEYDALHTEGVHTRWKEHLPPTPGLALDIGAGSGLATPILHKIWPVTAFTGTVLGQKPDQFQSNITIRS